MGDLERDTEVLTHHWRQSSGLSWNSPDGCACGVKTRPAEGDEDVSERRARAFAAHLAEMLAEARDVSSWT